MPARVGIVILAAISPFLFPTPVTILLGTAAACVFPPIAIGLGILIDLLYQPAHYWPVGTIVGVVICLMSVAVRSFVKARIM